MAYLDDNLPLGTIDDPDAPWNEIPPVEVEATVSITLSKPVTLIMPKKDDYTQQELLDAAKEQLVLDPAFHHWDIDDFVVVEE